MLLAHLKQELLLFNQFVGDALVWGVMLSKLCLEELKGIGVANGTCDSGLERRCVHWEIFVWLP